MDPSYYQVGVRVLSVLANAVRTAGKLDIRNADAPTFPEEASIPTGSRDDLEIVRLAVETGDTLVTTDVNLSHDLNACGILEAYNLRLLSPGEALERL